MLPHFSIPRMILSIFINEKRGISVDIQTIFDPDNAVWSFLMKLYSLALAGLLWFICSLPIFTLGPATIALFTYCFALLDGRESYLLRTFFSTFASSFKQGIVVTIIVLAATVFLAFDAWFFLNTIPFLFFAAVALYVLLLFPSLHIFALMSVQEKTIKEHCTRAFIFSITHIATTITVLVVIVLWFLSIYALPATIIFSAGPACIVVSMFLRLLYKRIGAYVIN